MDVRCSAGVEVALDCYVNQSALPLALLWAQLYSIRSAARFFTAVYCPMTKFVNLPIDGTTTTAGVLPR